MDWTPQTKLGRDVANDLVSLHDIFMKGKKILEPEIIDHLVPGLKSNIILIGGSPGKGGGQRRTPTKRTVRMHRSGRRYRVSAMAIIGNGDGYIGIGAAKAKEHREAIRKATKKAKLGIMPVKRGCGSWECGCGANHSVPYQVEGKAGSVRVVLIPAPRGIGLCTSDEAKKIMEFVGIKDIWTACFGKSKTRTNYVMAILDAFKKLNRIKGGIEFIPSPDIIFAKEISEEKEVGTKEAEEAEEEKKAEEIIEDIKQLEKNAKKLKKKEQEIEEELAGEA